MNLQAPLESITCKRCGTTDEFTVEAVGTVKYKAICDHCEEFITWIPYDEPRLYFGKYKGMAIAEITDYSYLRWVLVNVRLSKRTVCAIENRIYASPQKPPDP